MPCYTDPAYGEYIKNGPPKKTLQDIIDDVSLDNRILKENNNILSTMLCSACRLISVEDMSKIQQNSTRNLSDWYADHLMKDYAYNPDKGEIYKKELERLGYKKEHEPPEIGPYRWVKDKKD